nr:MAG TPA: hypothetical protein [Bacteriophage sp.]
MEGEDSHPNKKSTWQRRGLNSHILRSRKYRRYSTFRM